MIPAEALLNSKLKKFTREFSAGEFIFEEGFLGDSLYLIIEGTVGIYKKTSAGRRLIHTVWVGDVVGEKAIISEPGFKHSTSAQAKTTTTVVEADRRGFALVQSLVPDIFMRMLKGLELRLDQANELVKILYSTNEVDRISEFTSHYFKYNKRLGKDLQITLDDITTATNTDAVLTQKALDELAKKQILKAAGRGFILIDEVALLQYAPELRDRLAA